MKAKGCETGADPGEDGGGVVEGIPRHAFDGVGK